MLRKTADGPPWVDVASGRLAAELREKVSSKYCLFGKIMKTFAVLSLLLAASSSVSAFAPQSTGGARVSTAVHGYVPDGFTAESYKKFKEQEAAKKKRTEAAKKAMDEYMEQDDGAGAWLNSLAEIVSDEEEDEPSSFGDVADAPSSKGK